MGRMGMYRAAHSHFLMEIIRALWLKAGPIINLDFRNSRERLAGGGVLRRHARAFEGVAAGDGESARLAIADDIQSAADFILARLERDTSSSPNTPEFGAR